MNIEWKVKGYFLQMDDEELAIAPVLPYGLILNIDSENIPVQYHGAWACHGKNAKGDFIFRRETKKSLESSPSPDSPPPVSSVDK